MNREDESLLIKKIEIDISMDELKIIRDRMLKMCQTCMCVKPPRVHHCRKCNRCVVRMDHHCPWVGNCVGFYNQKQFLLFNIYVLYLCIFTIIDAITEGIITLMSRKDCEHPYCGLFWRRWPAVIAFGGAIIFGLFTLSMIY
jgi:hypothetical protein